MIELWPPVLVALIVGFFAILPSLGIATLIAALKSHRRNVAEAMEVFPPQLEGQNSLYTMTPKRKSLVDRYPELVQLVDVENVAAIIQAVTDIRAANADSEVIGISDDGELIFKSDAGNIAAAPGYTEGDR